MSSEEQDNIQAIEDSIGAELVYLLYQNTGLNYHICSQNLISIFEHLSSRVSNAKNLSDALIQSIKVFKSYRTKKHF